MRVTSVRIVEVEGHIHLIATIDQWGFELEEVLAVPRADVPAIAQELATFLDGEEQTRKVTIGGQEYELWTPDRSTQPMVCVFNWSMKPDPPNRVPAKVSIPIAMLASTLAQLAALSTPAG